MTDETCANCKHWRPTHIDGQAGYGECHGAPPIQIQPPAIGRIARLAAWIITPDNESCGGFTRPKPTHEEDIAGTQPYTPETAPPPPEASKEGKANAKA